MTEILLSTGQRIEAARSRLYFALAPATEAETETVRYLTRALSTPGSLDTLITMVERAVTEAGDEANTDALLRDLEHMTGDGR